MPPAPLSPLPLPFSENPVAHWQARTVAWIDVRCYHRHCYLFEVSKACLNTAEHAVELLKAVRAMLMSLMGWETHVINPERTPLAQNAPCIVMQQRYTIWVTQAAAQWVCMWAGGRDWGSRRSVDILHASTPFKHLLCDERPVLSTALRDNAVLSGRKSCHGDHCGSILRTRLFFKGEQGYWRVYFVVCLMFFQSELSFLQL